MPSMEAEIRDAKLQTMSALYRSRRRDSNCAGVRSGGSKAKYLVEGATSRIQFWHLYLGRMGGLSDTAQSGRNFQVPIFRQNAQRFLGRTANWLSASLIYFWQARTRSGLFCPKHKTGQRQDYPMVFEINSGIC